MFYNNRLLFCSRFGRLHCLRCNKKLIFHNLDIKFSVCIPIFGLIGQYIFFNSRGIWRYFCEVPSSHLFPFRHYGHFNRRTKSCFKIRQESLKSNTTHSLKFKIFISREPLIAQSPFYAHFKQKMLFLLIVSYIIYV